MKSQLSDILRRHNRGYPCPICGGRAETPRGKGLRCAGFTLGQVSYCSREQHAGVLSLDISTSPPTYRHTLSKACGCGRPHDERYFSPPASPRSSSQLDPLEQTPVPIEVRHVVYSAVSDLLDLRLEALFDLTRRGLSPEAIDQTGYRSIPRAGEEYRDFIVNMVETVGERALLECPGFTDEKGSLDFWKASDRRDGYIVLYRDECGFISGLQLKILGDKYLTARGSKLSSVYHLAGTGGPGNDLYITEGATKATVASYLGGIWSFAVAGQSLGSQHIDVIKRLAPKRVIVALDQEDNVNTDRARERWCQSLLEHGLQVFTAVWEGEERGGAKGLDDLLFQGKIPRIEQVVQAPSKTHSASDTEGYLTLSEMRSEIGEYHVGPGEVRHEGGARRKVSVAPTVIPKTRIYRKDDNPRERGKGSSMWAEAKTIFPLPTHIKPRMKGAILWSSRDNKAIAVDLYS